MGRKACIGWVLNSIAIALVPFSTQAQTPATSPVSTRAADLSITPRAGVSYSTSGGGYDGFASFQGFFPLQQTPGKNLLYLVGQLLLDNDANLGGNLLVGYRFYSPTADRIYGTYLAYDNRDTGFNVFSQLGLGLETLGDTWDARINAYIPVGSTRQTVSDRSFDTGFQFNNFQFQRNQLVASGTTQQTRIRDFDAAISGFDAEAGGRILRFSDYGDLRGYAGLYYLSAGESAVGVRGRLEARPTNNLAVGVAVQHDGIFGTNVFATVSLSLPGTRPRGADPKSVVARMGEYPGRLNAIVVDRQREITKTSRVVADLAVHNPATGQPYIFQHVTLGANGNGTFENPFGAVQSALNASRSDGNGVVYVQAGSNLEIPAFTIPDRVQVLSTAPVQFLKATFQGNSLPDFQLPLSGVGAIRPRVNGTVTMGSDTVLSGFDITSTTGAGVTFTNVNAVDIRDNLIRNTADAGILGNGAAIATLARNQITSARNQGIYIQNVGTATVIDNRISKTIAGTTTIANPITGNITIGPITIPNPGSIIPLPSGQGLVIATAKGNTTIAGNTITETATQGVVLLNSTGNATITNNTIADTVGADFSTPIPPLGSLTLTTGQGIVVAGVNGNLEVSRNAVNRVRGQGIAVAGITNGTTTIANNTIRNTVDQGMVIGGTSGTTTIANNQISDVSARPLPITVPILGVITLSTGQGIGLINSIDTVNITNNTIERVLGILPLPAFPGGQGIQVANFSGQLNLNVTNNQIRNNNNDGVLIGLAGRTSGTVTPATANITFSGNTIENNGGATPVRGDGIGIGLEQDAVINNLLIENNTIRNNGDEGIDIRLGSQAFPIVNPTTAQLTGTIRNNTIANNGENGIRVQANGSTRARVAIDGNTASNNLQQGIELITSSVIGLGSPQLIANVQQNTITDNALSGFLAQTTPSLGVSQSMCINLRGNTITIAGPPAGGFRFVNAANLPVHSFSSVGNTATLAATNTVEFGLFQAPIIAPIANVAACP